MLRRLVPPPTVCPVVEEEPAVPAVAAVAVPVTMVPKREVL